MPTALFASGWGLLGSSFLVGLGSGVVPLFSVEAYLVSLAFLVPHGELAGAVIVTTAGHMLAKYVLYLVGRGVVRLPVVGGTGGRLRELRDSLQRRPRGPSLVLLSSATTGLPPFYLTSLLAGWLRWPPSRFLVVGGGGRLLRFTALVVLARLLVGKLW